MRRARRKVPNSLSRGGLVQRAKREVHQRHKNLFVRLLFTDANKNLVAIIAREMATGGGANTRYLTMFCVAVHPVLLNAFDRLADDDVTVAWQSPVLDEKEQRLVAVVLRSEK